SDNPTVSTSEGFESDNNATSSAATPFTAAVFTNCTLIGPSYRLTLPNGGTLASGYKRAARLRRNTQLKVYNSIFLDFQEGLHIDGTTTEANATANTLKWKNNILAGIVTVAKTLQVNTGSTFDITTWYNANNNTTVSTNANILTAPYNVTSATIYTGLDYRPATGSIAATGADFSDSSLLGTNQVSNVDSIEARIYPNPFASNFKINFISSNDEVVKVAIYDVTGRTIETKTIDYSEIETQEFGSNYNTGLYVVVVSQGQISKSFKIFKK
ncbi:T9SS type A sorting domain-containing protein, partial [Flavobacterium sp. SUN052]|uniref:T9SS type A sorting domain-containing protein n=1 Tax=Flavobacterium sp. SUN052 TaxID=3002441 RepID=UPI00237EC117